MPKKDLLFVLMLFAVVMGIFSLIATLNYLLVDLNLEKAAFTGVTALLFLVAGNGMFRWAPMGWYAFIGGMVWSIVLQVMNVLEGGFHFYKFNTLAFILLFIFVIMWMMDPEVKRKYKV